MNKSEIWKNYRFPIILLSGIMIGAVIGVIFGEKAKVLAPLGDIFSEPDVYDCGSNGFCFHIQRSGEHG